MAILDIVTLPDPRLREKSVEVKDFGPELLSLVENMAETMAWAKGIGLAAVQVGVMKRLLVLDIGDLSDDENYVEGDADSERRLADRRNESKLEVFINPVILKGEGEIEFEEGCLSVPGVYSTVCRKEKIKLRYQDLKGNILETEASGLKSIALQHEIDHMDGVVFTDRLGPMQRMAVLNKYKKLQKIKAEELEGEE